MINPSKTTPWASSHEPPRDYADPEDTPHPPKNGLKEGLIAAGVFVFIAVILLYFPHLAVGFVAGAATAMWSGE